MAAAEQVKVLHGMNELFRRLRQYESEGDWVKLVLEGAGRHAAQAALFEVKGDSLELRGQVNLNVAENLRIVATKAAAFEAVLRSKEPVTALRTAGEVGLALSASAKLAYLFPVFNGQRVAAILFTAAELQTDADALELISSMAGSGLERHGNSGLHTQITGAVAVSPPVKLPAWALYGPVDRDLHAQASRFARVTVAEMALAKPAACRAAKRDGGLYVVLGKEIDRARETYRKRFLTIPSMVDYLHRELVTTLLAGDASKLGADYPGAQA